MKVGLFDVVFVVLLLRAICDNNDEMRTKLEAMERSLAKMDAMEKRLAKMDAIEKHQEIMEKREEVTNKRLAVVEQCQQGKENVTSR